MHRRLVFLTANLTLLAAIVLAAVSAPKHVSGVTPNSVALAQSLRAETGVQPGMSSYSHDIVPLVKKYCTGCHAGDHPPAGINLTAYGDTASVVRAASIWQKVADNVQSQHMPPVGSPQPTSDERSRIVDWIQSTVSQANCKIQDPGRVTLHRLNREEYNNTVDDLLGVTLRPADEFPSDDVGYGFDNIGDVLSISPLLLEKYLTAAEELAHAAIIAPESRGSVTHYAANDLHGSPSLATPSGDKVLYTNGELGVDFKFPEDGDYAIRGRVYGQQAGPDPARLGIRLDHADAKTFDVPQTEELPGVFTVRVHVTAGVHSVGLAFLNDYYKPTAPNPKDRDRNLVVDRLAIEGPLTMPSVLPLSERRLITVRPKSTADRDACARKILTPFATRAFRRPATPDEIARLVKCVDRAGSQGASFERAIQLAVEAVLVSPNFIFRVEVDPHPSDPTAKHPVNDYELASRLSYFLWSTMPDAELFRLAGTNRLHDPAVLHAQVTRMLKSPKAHALAANFAGQWLQLRKLSTFAPDPQRFPDFDDKMRQSMRTESEMYFENVVTEDRSVLEFLDSDYSYLNEPLARHYGISGVYGDDFRYVRLANHERGGVLTQASVLTVTSNPTRTSPVKRGRWVLEQILGAPPPPPPPGVPQLDDKQHGPLVGTLRERMVQHRKDPACANCHMRMDPIGFGLENYNAVGAWRTTDEGAPIDASGTLPDGATFNGPAQLKQYLMAHKTQFVHALTEKMMTYAVGRGLVPADKCYVDAIAKSVDQNGYRMSTLIAGVVDSPPFRERRGDKGMNQ